MATLTVSASDTTQPGSNTSLSGQSPAYGRAIRGNVEESTSGAPSVRSGDTNNEGFRKIRTEATHITLAFTLNLWGLLLVVDEDSASPLYKVAALFHAVSVFVGIVAGILVIMRTQAITVFVLMLASVLVAFAGAVCIGQDARTWLGMAVPWIVGGNIVAIAGRYLHLVIGKMDEGDEH